MILMAKTRIKEHIGWESIGLDIVDHKISRQHFHVASIHARFSGTSHVYERFREILTYFQRTRSIH